MKNNDLVYNGIIIINKPKGFTSHDVVNKVRGILKIRKVGHTGTLDPQATGVLPVCVGKATKVSDMLTATDKEYVANVKLGICTDTQDIYGTVIKKCDSINVTKADILRALENFTGEIEQIPPMYSAIKINGKKMCDLARKGIEVERKPRKITIYSAKAEKFYEDGFSMRVHCSKGTYIRTLCDDIGKFLKCYACMSDLQRTVSGKFNISDAITFDVLENAANTGNLNSVILPVDTVFDNYGKYIATDEIVKRLKNGAPSTVNADTGLYRVYDKSNQFIAVGQVLNINGFNKIKAVKLFSSNE